MKMNRTTGAFSDRRRDRDVPADGSTGGAVARDARPGRRRPEAEPGGEPEAPASVRVDRDDRHQPQRGGEVAQAAARLLRRRRQADQASDGRAASLRQRPAAAGGRGGRVKEQVVENKKDEMQEYMEKAAALIHQYVPPSPERIQKAKDAGNVQAAAAAGREGARRAAELRSALGRARHRRRREGGHCSGAQRRDLSRQAGGRGDARRRLRHPGRRHQLRGADDARGHGEEHQRGRRELRPSSAGT